MGTVILEARWPCWNVILPVLTCKCALLAHAVVIQQHFVHRQTPIAWLAFASVALNVVFSHYNVFSWRILSFFKGTDFQRKKVPSSRNNGSQYDSVSGGSMSQEQLGPGGARRYELNQMHMFFFDHKFRGEENCL